MPKRPKYVTPEWSSDLAYAIGLITTDGSLSKDRRHIIFTSTDIALIKTLLHCLNKTNKIINNPIGVLNKKQAYRVQISDVTLYRWLENIGLFANKSLSLSSLKIPMEFFPDFLRGHLDGDGSIVHYIDRYNTKVKATYIYTRLFVYLMSGSEKHILWLREQVREIIGTKGSLSKRVSKSQKGIHACWVLKFSTKQAKILLNWIYYKEALPCLERKFMVAKPFLGKCFSAA